MGKFVIKQAKDGQFYFNLKATNGQVILSSEMYTTLKACENGIASVKKNAPEEARYDLKQSESGKFHFNLKAANHQVIGSSQMYQSEESAKNGIASVMNNAPEAEVVNEIEGKEDDEPQSAEPAAEAAPVVEEAPAVEAPKAEAPKAAKKSTLNASVAPEDFDWDAFEGSDVYGGVDKAAIEEAYDKTLSKIVENDVVEGVVTAMNKREVVVAIGGKSEGVIPVSEFRYDSELKVGDKVEVYVESAEDRKGQLVLSHRKARTLKSWDRVNEAGQNRDKSETKNTALPLSQRVKTVSKVSQRIRRCTLSRRDKTVTKVRQKSDVARCHAPFSSSKHFSRKAAISGSSL